MTSVRTQIARALRWLAEAISPPDPLAGMFIKAPPPLVAIRIHGESGAVELRYVDAAQVQYVVHATLATLEDTRRDAEKWPLRWDLGEVKP